ncbi:Late embryogenesis abundant protein, LEA-14 [Spatholobus suberectus]|nr:Late embryogenesis abundant protein, LEA-14 [Spatholobus suberectus]
MEERVSPPPPPPLEHTDKNHSPKLQLPDIDPGTYVVQVPKDQVYRVPPPENARIVEQHRNSPPKEAKTSRCCWCCVLFFIVFVALLILLGGVLGGLFSMLLKPKDPNFSIQSFKVVESKPYPKYDVTLQVHNSNSKVGVSYKDRGRVSLSLRRQEIASGAYQTSYQDPHDTTTFGVTLKGSKAGFPKEVEESVKNDKKKMHVTFSLAIRVLARMKMGLLRSGTMTFDVTCKLKLDTLAKNTHVLSQQCETKRH